MTSDRYREREERRPALLDASDVLNAASFLALWPAAWILPEAAWPILARALAGLHIALRGASGRNLQSVLPAITSTQSLERAILAGKYEETLQMLREHRPGGWAASIRVVGLENVRAAIDCAGSAVLWIAPCNFAELNVKKGLHAANHSIINLRSAVHPYSSTRFGRAVLNRVRTSIEDRYLADTVTLQPGKAALALRELQLKLRPGVLATITANSAGERTCAIPFLGGTMHLALGAATLARVARVPLLAVFARPREAGSFAIEVHGPLEASMSAGGRKRDEELGHAFARELEAFVKRYPGVWRGWFNAYQWQPPAHATPE